MFLLHRLKVISGNGLLLYYIYRCVLYSKLVYKYIRVLFMFYVFSFQLFDLYNKSRNALINASKWLDNFYNKYLSKPVFIISWLKKKKGIEKQIDQQVTNFSIRKKKWWKFFKKYNAIQHLVNPHTTFVIILTWWSSKYLK